MCIRDSCKSPCFVNQRWGGAAAVNKNATLAHVAETLTLLRARLHIHRAGDRAQPARGALHQAGQSKLSHTVAPQLRPTRVTKQFRSLPGGNSAASLA